MKLRLFQADAFTSEPFAGNPAAVTLLPFGFNLDDSQRLKIAKEMNISETAFIELLSADDCFETSATFRLRWFTPMREVPLCGHATMASAAVLMTSLGNTSALITFQTLSGDLKVSKHGDTISMDLPAMPAVAHDFESVKHVVKHVIGDLPVRACMISARAKKLLVHLDDSVSRAQLESLQPDAAAMLREQFSDPFQGIIVTIRGKKQDGGYDFLSRYFSPWNLGLANYEDPVTGSAHSVLVPYWSGQLGSMELKARQCSPRGGDLMLTFDDPFVKVAGQAVIVFEGTLFL